jgi:hypothetical protein
VDVGDASGAPGWDGGANSTNAWHQSATDYALDAVAAEEPNFVLVAGDLVMGHWDYDYDNREIFGPTGTLTEKRAALNNTAACYYPQWKQRFSSRSLIFHGAVGDHEIGDNNWGVNTDKSRLVPDYKDAFATYITKTGGTPRYSNRPVGTDFEDTAYAFQRGNTLFVTVDVFKFTDASVQLGPYGTVNAAVEDEQLTWLQNTLAGAQTDPNIKHIIVQGHTPCLTPVRGQGSHIVMPGGENTDFWQSLEQYNVDLYLCGEVHNMSASNHGGVEQVAHGGLIGYGFVPSYPAVNYMVMIIDGNTIDLKLKSIDQQSIGSSKLWQTGGNRPSEEYYLDTANGYQTVGTLTINKNSGQTIYENRTGYFIWYGTSPTEPNELLTHHHLDESPGSTTAVNAGYTGPPSDGLVSGADFITSGKLNNALQFSLGDRVTAGATPVTGGADPRTVSAWVKSTVSSGVQTFLTMGTNDVGTKWDMDVDGTCGCFELGVGCGRTDGSGSTTINDGTWHHLVTVFPDGGTILPNTILYVDAVPISFTVNANRDIVTTGGELIFGHSANGSSTQQFSGELDDPAVWSLALSATDVKALYNLANENDLRYDASNADILFDAFASVGDIKIGERLWVYQASGIGGSNGDVIDLGNGQFSLNLGSNAGFTSIHCPVVDLDGNCWVDLSDFAVLGYQWLQAPSEPPARHSPPLVVMVSSITTTLTALLKNSSKELHLYNIAEIQ